jgi:hypothetical protein
MLMVFGVGKRGEDVEALADVDEVTAQSVDLGFVGVCGGWLEKETGGAVFSDEGGEGFMREDSFDCFVQFCFNFFCELPFLLRLFPCLEESASALSLLPIFLKIQSFLGFFERQPFSHWDLSCLIVVAV